MEHEKPEKKVVRFVMIVTGDDKKKYSDMYSGSCYKDRITAFINGKDEPVVVEPRCCCVIQ